VTHDRFEEMLARRSELTAAEEARLQAHLEGCSRCRETAAAYQQQTRLLRSLPGVEPPTSLRAGVLAGIHTLPPRRSWWSLRPALLLGPVAAVLLLAGVLALHAMSTGNRSTTTAAPPVPTSAPRPHPGPQSPGTGKLSAASSNPAHRSHPARHSPPAQRPVVAAPTALPPAQTGPGLALGPVPTQLPGNPPAGPVQAPPPSSRSSAARSSSPRPVKVVAPRPLPTSPPAARPPVVVAPARPTPIPAPTVVPPTDSPITASGPSTPPSPQPFLTPTPTATALP
jgi:hypothetical protein